MKKKISAVLAMALCLSVFVGCSSKQNQFYIQLESGETVAYGMEKSEVERILGEPKDKDTIMGPTYFCGLQIAYREDKVVAIMTEDVKQSVKTDLGVSVGDEVEQCYKIIGEPNNSVSTSTSLKYFYQILDGKISLFEGNSTDLSEMIEGNEQDLKNLINVEYQIYNNKISSIYIADMCFAIYLK